MQCFVRPSQRMTLMLMRELLQEQRLFIIYFVEWVKRLHMFIHSDRVKDVSSHCYCASLVRTLFIGHTLPRHVFQACAPNRNSTKYRADDLCVNLVCEYFCWMLGDPHFFFSRSLPFLILSVIVKNQKNLYVRSFNYFSFTIHIRSNLYMDTGVSDLGAARLILPDLMTYVAKICQGR